MAQKQSVWGIEIGQSALKALRCRLDGNTVVAEAFDYIEYPKILSQPEAEPEAMVREALETFVARNDLKKCKVALSVPGQSGLAKFFKPPPVELKKIPDIVKYEAKQQIPFDLKDVIWDYQLMAGGDISDGFALESEVGLFAMKRDAVLRALKPLQVADIEIDLLQLAPLSIYNMVTSDLALTSDDTPYDTEHPPKSMVVLAMGTDATDLIVTNGYRVWQRSMPLGGNHFTRQLTKDLKLTFAKAEHLKRHAMEADDPKLIFQAMRPVFNDLVTEVQRSMGFFRSLNKKAEIGSILMLGNSVKLPGLAQYLSKNLAMDVQVLEKFEQLTGDDVIAAPAFKEHVAAFGPVYGLCLQVLGKGPAQTNLVPSEVLQERLIRSKKPWAVAAAAILLMGFAGNLLPASGRWKTVAPEKWQSAMTAATNAKSASDAKIAEDGAQTKQVELLAKIGQEVSGNGDRKLLILELTNALYQALGRNPGDARIVPSPLDVPYSKRTDLHVTRVDSKYYEALSTWYTEDIKKLYEEDEKTRLDRLGLLNYAADQGATGGAATEPPAATGTADPATAASTGASGGEDTMGLPGWVFQINGYHYHNGKEYAENSDELEEFVLKTLIHRLETGSAILPTPDGEMREFTFKELGIGKPFVLSGVSDPVHKIPNPEWVKKYGNTAAGMSSDGGLGSSGGLGGSPMAGGAPMMGGGMPGSGMAGSGVPGAKIEEDPTCPRFFEAPRYTFVVQFCWQEKPLTARLEAQKKAKEEAEAAAKAAAGEPAEGTPVVVDPATVSVSTDATPPASAQPVSSEPTPVPPSEPAPSEAPPSEAPPSEAPPSEAPPSESVPTEPAGGNSEPATPEVNAATGAVNQ